MTRSPWTDPAFGDVFQFISTDSGLPYPFTVYLCRRPGSTSAWWGLDLHPGPSRMAAPNVIEMNVLLDPEDWEYIGNIG